MWAERVIEAMGSMTMGELARACDVNVSTISRFLSGKNGVRRNPGDELKWKIAGATHQRMDKLFAYPAVIPPRPDTMANVA